jgi:hypothetical protein
MLLLLELLAVTADCGPVTGNSDVIGLGKGS